MKEKQKEATAPNPTCILNYVYVFALPQDLTDRHTHGLVRFRHA